eukprot:gene24027-biopygen10409
MLLSAPSGRIKSNKHGHLFSSDGSNGLGYARNGLAAHRTSRAWQCWTPKTPVFAWPGRVNCGITEETTGRGYHRNGNGTTRSALRPGAGLPHSRSLSGTASPASQGSWRAATLWRGRNRKLISPKGGGGAATGPPRNKPGV